MPGCNIDVQGLVIPVGSKNVKSTHDFINWIMTPDQNAEFDVGPGEDSLLLSVCNRMKHFRFLFIIEVAKAAKYRRVRTLAGNFETSQ